MGVPQNVWFIRENPIEIDDTSYFHWIQVGAMAILIWDISNSGPFIGHIAIYHYYVLLVMWDISNMSWEIHKNVGNHGTQQT